MTADSVRMMGNEIYKSIYNNSTCSCGNHLYDHTKTGTSAGYMGGNELKTWGEMTEVEINQNIQEQCQYCMYRSRNGTTLYCDYFTITDGTLRKCSPINCEKFKEDDRVVRKSKPVLVKQKRRKRKA